MLWPHYPHSQTFLSTLASATIATVWGEIPILLSGRTSEHTHLQYKSSKNAGRQLWGPIQLVRLYPYTLCYLLLTWLIFISFILWQLLYCLLSKPLQGISPSCFQLPMEQSRAVAQVVLPLYSLQKFRAAFGKYQTKHPEEVGISKGQSWPRES